MTGDVGVNNNTQPIIIGITIIIVALALIFIPTLKTYVTLSNSLENILQIIGGLFIIPAGYIFYKQWKNLHNNITTNSISDYVNSSAITYKTFVDNLILNKCEEISLMAHTGKNTLEILRQRIINDTDKLNINIQIILKHPHSETTTRFKQITSHLDTFKYDIEKKNCTVEFRYYSGLPYFHAILCKYKNTEEYLSYISYYQWNENHKTIACKTGSIVNSNTNELFIVAKSWFEHLFSKKKLHTIVFDLDDTIINSYDSQIKSWLFLLECIFDNKKGLGRFQRNIKPGITKDSLQQLIEAIFLKTIKTEERWKYLFDNCSDTDIQELEKIRFKKRTELTLNDSVLFDECRITIERLSKIYNLVIISATSEEIVKKILDKHNLSPHFSLYLGKDNHAGIWNTVEDKTPYLIKISNLIGIPFDRIVFIGDSPTDFNAAKQLNIHFIAANMVAKKLNQSSLIHGHTGLSFDTYQNMTLFNIIEREFN